MKKMLIPLLLILLASCRNERSEGRGMAPDNPAADTTLIAEPEETATVTTLAPERTTANPDESVTGTFISGKEVTAIATLIKQSEGNPAENGTAAQYSITFNDPDVRPIPVGCCEIILVNEGDLNDDGTDELSVCQAPMNGCTFNYSTYTYANGKWKQVIPLFLIPTGCDGINRDSLEKRVVKENGKVYILQKDMADENGKLIKKQVVL